MKKFDFPEHPCKLCKMLISIGNIWCCRCETKLERRLFRRAMIKRKKWKTIKTIVE